jgi:hypothetical protein
MLAALLSVTVPARADVSYTAFGQDDYRIESAQTSTKVTYAGTERLSIRQVAKAMEFEARARYTRTGPDGKRQGDARFVQMEQPDGTFEDRVDEDPDFLTILNQPFAVRLDPTTFRDLRALKTRVPFSATSPLGAQAVLHGFLRPATGGPIAGRQTVAVRFEAEGAMTGPLPGYGEMLVAGMMRMNGTAYYAVDSAVLLALNIDLMLDARLAERGQPNSVPVQIVYRRRIKATAKMPPPARLGAGVGTAAHATP